MRALGKIAVEKRLDIGLRMMRTDEIGILGTRGDAVEKWHSGYCMPKDEREGEYGYEDSEGEFDGREESHQDYQGLVECL